MCVAVLKTGHYEISLQVDLPVKTNFRTYVTIFRAVLFPGKNNAVALYRNSRVIHQCDITLMDKTFTIGPNPIEEIERDADGNIIETNTGSYSMIYKFIGPY